MKHSFKDLKNLSGKERLYAIEEVVIEEGHNLPNYDKISSLIAMTNALGWGLDVVEIEESSIQENATEITGKCDISLDGEQADDKMFHGDTITGTADFTIKSNSVEFTNIEAEINRN